MHKKINLFLFLVLLNQAVLSMHKFGSRLTNNGRLFLRLENLLAKNSAGYKRSIFSSEVHPKKTWFKVENLQDSYVYKFPMTADSNEFKDAEIQNVVRQVKTIFDENLCTDQMEMFLDSDWQRLAHVYVCHEGGEDVVMVSLPKMKKSGNSDAYNTVNNESNNESWHPER